MCMETKLTDQPLKCPRHEQNEQLLQQLLESREHSSLYKGILARACGIKIVHQHAGVQIFGDKHSCRIQAGFCCRIGT